MNTSATKEIPVPARRQTHACEIPIVTTEANPAKTVLHPPTRGIWTKAWIMLASVILMGATLLLIGVLHLFKFFAKIKRPDPFHDSRRHPLNDPTAPRG